MKLANVDRLSASVPPSPAKPQDGDFHQLHSPSGPVKTDSTTSQQEDGALRAGGPPDIYAWKNIGIFAQYAAIGVIYGTMYSIVYPFLTNYLRMSGSETASASVLITLPYTLKVFFGFITDCFPIFGYRRRPYMVIGWTVCFVSLLVMVILPVEDPYYPENSWAYLKTLTEEQTAQLNKHAPQSGVKYIFLMVIANLGSVIAFTASDGILVELSQREPENARGSLQSLVYAVQYAFMILSYAMIGFGLNSDAYGGAFTSSMGFNAVMGVCACFAAAVIPLSWFCISEEKSQGPPVRKFLKSLYELIQQRVVYQIIIFRFFRNLFAWIFVTADWQIQSYWVGVTPVNSSIASIIGSIVESVTLYAVKRWGLNWNWWWMLAIAQILTTVLDAIPTFLAVWDVFRDQWFWLGVPLVENVPSTVAFIVTTFAVLEIIEEGSEASTYGLITTVSTLASPFATVLTKNLDAPLNLDNASIVKDDHTVHMNATYAYLIAYGTNILSLIFLVLMPKQKAQTQELKRTGGKSKLIGTITVIGLLFTLIWSVMTNVMTMFPSTACLQIAGGSGC